MVKDGDMHEQTQSNASGATVGTDQLPVLDFSKKHGMIGYLPRPMPRPESAGAVPHAGGKPETTGMAPPVPGLTPVPVPSPSKCPRPAEVVTPFDVNGPAADAYRASNAKPAMDKLILDHFSLKNPGRSGS